MIISVWEHILTDVLHLVHFDTLFVSLSSLSLNVNKDLYKKKKNQWEPKKDKESPKCDLASFLSNLQLNPVMLRDHSAQSD